MMALRRLLTADKHLPHPGQVRKFWEKVFAPFARPPKRSDLYITGKRLTLRPLSPEDAEAMFGFATDPEVTRFLPWESNTTLPAVRLWLSEQADRRRRGQSLGFAIVHNDTGMMIGSTDLMELKLRAGQAELGYLLARNYWNQGLMSEATHLTLAYGFDTMHLTKIYAWVDEANIASRRVLEKLGMQFAERETRLVKSEYRSYLRYEIERLRHETERGQRKEV